MAIIRNTQKEIQVDKHIESSFTEDEATFLISKLREANYKGTEFETFYKVMSKLAKITDK